MLKRKKELPPLIDRDWALNARPEKMPCVKKEMINGKLYITLEFIRPSWQQMLGAEKNCTRVFGLDAYGQRVYELCDGKHTIKNIIAKFAEKHHISIPEAETAVTSFIKTLMAKGMIGINMENTADSAK